GSPGEASVAGRGRPMPPRPPRQPASVGPGGYVEVKIGIQSIPRELVVDTDTPAEEIERALSDALAGTDGQSVFALDTVKGGRLLTPADKIAFIEFSPDQARRVGFGNIV